MLALSVQARLGNGRRVNMTAAPRLAAPPRLARRVPEGATAPERITRHGVPERPRNVRTVSGVLRRHQVENLAAGPQHAPLERFPPAAGAEVMPTAGNGPPALSQLAVGAEVALMAGNSPLRGGLIRAALSHKNTPRLKPFQTSDTLRSIHIYPATKAGGRTIPVWRRIGHRGTVRLK